MSGPRYSGPNQPPEHGESRTDPWGWLYRENGEVDPVEPADQAAPSGPQVHNSWPSGPQPYERLYRQPAEPQPYEQQPQPYEQQPQPYQQQPYPQQGYGFEPLHQIPDYQPVPPGYASTSAAAGTPGSANPLHPAGPPEEPRRRRGLMLGLVIGALALVLVLALVLIQLGRTTTSASPVTTRPSSEPSSQGDPSATAPSSTAPTSPAAEATYDGKVSSLTATGATADCVAPNATDGNGDPVSYAAAEAVDGDLNTAWRCDGDGADESIRVALPQGSAVARLGLVNGYAKVDPGTDDERYPEYRRITEVRWTLSNGATFDQTLKDKTQTQQNLAVPLQKDVSWVQLTILKTTSPGSKLDTRDAVLISEIGVAAPV